MWGVGCRLSGWDQGLEDKSHLVFGVYYHGYTGEASKTRCRGAGAGIRCVIKVGRCRGSRFSKILTSREVYQLDRQVTREGARLKRQADWAGV